MINDRPALLRYAVATVLPGLALALAELIPARADPSHFSLFFIAVMLSSWYGGLGAGLLATILSALSLEFFLSPSTSSR
jgi:K+-sensing histidine kinase KdpD